MQHRSMINMKLEYPYIMGEFEDGNIFQYNVVEKFVPQRL